MNALCALLQQSGTSVLCLGRWYENDPVQSLLVGFMCKNNGLEMKDFLASFRSFSWVQLCILCFSCKCCSIVKIYSVELN